MSTRLVQCLMLFGWVIAMVLATSNTGRSSYPRPSRGFKSSQLSTARGFGKRDGRLYGAQQSLSAAAALSPSNIDGIVSPPNYDSRTSYPYSWLIEELQKNPEAARMFVERFLEEHGDGELSPEESYRKPYY